jgi:membrane fusion protein (multidrug efflux system)
MSLSGMAILAPAATAVLYAPYGDSVFIVEDAPDKKGKVLHQQFVRLGLKRGDFVAVTSGLREGQTVVSTGVFKLRNGQAVGVDNTLAPNFRKAPKPENS